MAEFIAAFGIAVNIMTFIDFSCKILSTGYRMHSSGSNSQEHQDLNVITNDLIRVTGDLDNALQQDELKQNSSSDDIHLQRLADQCRVVCLELQVALQKLKVHGQPRKWNTFRVALKTVWNEDKIEALQKRIEQFRQELIICMLASFR